MRFCGLGLTGVRVYNVGLTGVRMYGVDVWYGAGLTNVCLCWMGSTEGGCIMWD